MNVAETALSAALAAWQKPPIGVTVESATVATEEKKTGLQGFAQSSPGMLVQFTIFGLTTTALKREQAEEKEKCPKNNQHNYIWYD